MPTMTELLGKLLMAYNLKGFSITNQKDGTYLLIEFCGKILQKCYPWMWKVTICTGYPENPEGIPAQGIQAILLMIWTERNSEKHQWKIGHFSLCLNREKKEKRKKKSSAEVTLNTLIQGSDTCCLPSNHTSQLAIICKPHNIPSLKTSVHYDLFIFISF